MIISAKEKGKEYKFSVKDNGIGIAKEYHQQIFLLFKTLESKSISGSSGIGLATCKKIAEQHGATHSAVRHAEQPTVCRATRSPPLRHSPRRVRRPRCRFLRRRYSRTTFDLAAPTSRSKSISILKSKLISWLNVDFNNEIEVDIKRRKTW